MKKRFKQQTKQVYCNFQVTNIRFLCLKKKIHFIYEGIPDVRYKPQKKIYFLKNEHMCGN